MRIYFLRHGESKNDKLTKNGKLQVKCACYYLAKCNISAVYSSPANRCKETSKIVCENLKQNFEVVNDLRERESIAEIVSQDDKEWYDNYLNTTYPHSNPEGGKEFFERIRNSVNNIIVKNSVEKNILIVGHSSNIYAIATLFFKTEKNATWLQLGTASVVCFEK